MISVNPVYIPKLVLIGVGLIGGSLLKVLQKENAVGEVVGVGRGVENLQLAHSMGVIDRFTHDAAEAVQEADMVVIATPVGAFETILEQILPHLKKDAIVTDVGSVKGEIVLAARRVLGTQIDQFVPAHPIAGSENSGVMAAMVNLFVDHNVIITPLPETRTEFRSVVEQMWRLTEARIVEMDIDLHDQVLGVTSHLPHVIVFALIDYLSRQDKQALHYQFAAGGLYDLTRIASSDARMWSDICMNNKDKLIPIIRGYAQDLMQMADQIEADEGDKLIKEFEQAKLARGRVADYRK
ncbi:MAG: prephenate dehydrogenase/arogenate dehydrogenase family protein [Proteobacteria bacterium]|nr:prephenate dehydrogenase/arogenate dehydrogenase family protein [Pseudomonadota bacterium]